MFARRLEFCLRIGEKIMDNRRFYKTIIFSDESTFTTNGVPSSQNCRYWSQTYPHFKIANKSKYFKKKLMSGVAYRMTMELSAHILLRVG